jgi:cell wall-associated NlpC family hydrolase
MVLRCWAFRLSSLVHRDPVAIAAEAPCDLGAPIVGTYRLVNRFLIILIAAASLLALSLVTSHQAASAGTRARHEAAFLWARTQAGRPYCWGGNGPSCYDCSGLVAAAYARQGLHFGRSTTAMLASGRLIRERESQARRGDLAFYGTGHVEFFVRPGHTFGALDAGTRIWWHRWSRWWHPTMFFRVRGAG